MTSSSGKPLRILLVDDNATNLKVLSEALNDHAWTTLVATDGVSAIEQAQYAQPNLILLDVMMPGIDGFETCQQLKAKTETQSIPIIFMTALADADHKVRGLEMGAVDYITKPFNQEEVIARVKLHLRLSTLTQQLEEQNVLLSQEITEKKLAEKRLKQLSQELEHRVQQRTIELTNSLEQLKKAQLQLVQSEKMSALGGLVAGVAHELNNPISFLQGNLEPARDYIQDLWDLLDLYQKTFPDPGPAINEKIDRIELDFLRQDLEKILLSWSAGMERIYNISVSLRAFSRADKETKVRFDVRDGLDSTLLILRHRLKENDYRPEIQIQKNYQDITEIDCFAGQLNQVFMNLLANAIDAIDDMGQVRSFEESEAQPHVISLDTCMADDDAHIVITISDNGIGINDAVKPRIFDYLFTTKAVDRGTGLGLAIVRQIVVEKHGGGIEVVSTPMQGTCFTLTLPVKTITDGRGLADLMDDVNAV